MAASDTVMPDSSDQASSNSSSSPSHTKSTSPVVMWFRADLRLYDNPALYAACNATNNSAPNTGHCIDQSVDQNSDQGSNSVVAVYALCEQQWDEHDIGPNKRSLIIRQLKMLEADLAKLSIPLVVLNCGTFAAVPDALVTFSQKHGARELFCNLEYEFNERQLSAKTREKLASHGITMHSYHDQCAVAPGALLNKQGQMYQVYSSFRNRYLAEADLLERPLWPAPLEQQKTNVESDLSVLPDDPADPSVIALWPAGEDEAHERLVAFVETRLKAYKRDRDMPALEGTSVLSPYLAIGALSSSQCFHALKSLSGGAYHAAQGEGSKHEGYTTWLNELIWREFYRHFMVAFPQVCRYQAFKKETEALPWRQEGALFEAWSTGQTGYPIVDAGMRQLIQTGWMHNRVRMICAMFLTKHLFVDWRLGERFFMQHLIDGDLASNNGGWQWSASTGVDAVPYFRIFNPTRQSERFDADGEYIRRYVPELKALTNKEIHNPSLEVRRMYGYAEPIVEHKAAVAQTKDHFASLSKN